MYSQSCKGNKKITQWCLRRMYFMFYDINRPDDKQQGAGGLLRLHTTGRNDIEIDADISVLLVQQHNTKKNVQSYFKHQDRDHEATILESRPILKTKTDDVELKIVSRFIHAQSKQRVWHQMKHPVDSSNCHLTSVKTGLFV